jgi:hypothetical protein
MRARLRPLLLLPVFAALLAGCATGPRSIEISQQQLQSALERRFPYEARPGGLFLVNVGVPRLQLLPETNRVRLDFALEASDRIARNATRGELGVSFSMRYEPADSSLRAANVRVEQVGLPGLPGDLRGPLQAIGGLVAENLLEDTVLHTFRPEEIARARGWRPGGIRVTPTGVRVELLPPA